MLEVGAVVGGAVENEHVGGQGGGEGGGPEDQALYFVCVLPRVQCSRTPLGEPEWGSSAQNRGGGEIAEEGLRNKELSPPARANRVLLPSRTEPRK